MPLAMNTCTFVGNVAGDPQFKPSNGEQGSRLFFVIAVQRPTKFEGHTVVDYICCQARGKQAEDGSRYISKGKQLGVIGALNLFGENNTKHVIAVQRINYGPDSKRQRELAETDKSNDDDLQDTNLPE